MWSYYGTKKRIQGFYPNPVHDTIIEPFAGAAQYSLYNHNWERNVILIDKYDVIINIWQYLINAKEKDILSLPDITEGDNLNNYKQLLSEEKDLMGFCINCGSASPKKTAKKYNCWNKTKKEIAKNLYKIRHWKVFCDDYTEISNKKATWFIDPPYQFGGQWYAKSNKNIDYIKLADWCRSRKGQVIVCENTKANWLPFVPIVKMSGQLHETMEVIWNNHLDKISNKFFN